jgi:hypothetical protein
VLPKIHMLNDHFQPQVTRLCEVGKFIKMESQLPELNEVLKVDLSYRKNCSTHGPSKEYYDDESLDIIGKLYKEDFIRLDYPVLL